MWRFQDPGVHLSAVGWVSQPAVIGDAWLDFPDPSQGAAHTSVGRKMQQLPSLLGLSFRMGTAGAHEGLHLPGEVSSCLTVLHQIAQSVPGETWGHLFGQLEEYSGRSQEIQIVILVVLHMGIARYKEK